MVGPLAVVLAALCSTMGAPAASAAGSAPNQIAVIRLIRHGIAAQDVTYGLFLVDTRDGTATRLYKADTFLFKGSWSPDRAQLAFTQADIGGLGACHVYLIDANGSDPHLIRDTPFGTCPFHPSWSPDGTRLLFQEGLNLFSMAVDGSDVQQLTTFDTPKAYLSGVTWSPDGTEISFARDTPRGNGRLYVANADGTGETVIHSCRTKLCRAGYQTSDPSWSPSGRRISFEEARNIYTIRPNGGGQRRITDCRRTLRYQLCSASASTWSPESDRLAFISDGRLRIVRLVSGWIRTLGPTRVGGSIWNPGV
jgi:Tol biopolymer transport system component